MEKKQGILVVSFGTNHEKTRKQTIGAIEDRIRENFRNYAVYGAFTSKMILKKLKKSGINVYSVQEALEAMIRNGVTEELIIQPTYVVNGMQNEKVLNDIKEYQKYFKKIKYGTPLLSQEKDYKELAQIIESTYHIEDKEALVLMGHGSKQHFNSAYYAFDDALKSLGFRDIFIGTIKGKPDLEEVKMQLKKEAIKKVCLVPMMIVAGAHANNEMIGEKNSWKIQLEQEGYLVRYWLKGLGEIKKVQEMFVKHVEEAE